MPANQLNIVLIMSDQHRADAIGAAGHPVVQTPALDRLAREGVRFNRAYCQGPLCMPARASFLTERYVRDHGVSDNTFQLEGDWPTYVQKLREAGYHTAAIGKLHLYTHAGSYDTRDRLARLHALGYDDVSELVGKMASRHAQTPYHDYLKQEGLLDVYLEWAAKPVQLWEPLPWTLPVEAYQDSWVGRETVNWIDRYARDQPFFIQVGFPGPHSPWDAPPSYVERYADAELPFASTTPPERAGDGPLDQFLKMWYPMRQIPDGVSNESIHACRRAYYAAITLIDEWIGGIMAALARRGILEDTWIVYTTDHGEMMGDHRMYEKVVFYEPSVRVPLIIRPPGGIAGSVVEGIVEHIDAPATMRDLAGAGAVPASDGHSLRGHFPPESAGFTRALGISENHGFACFITRRHKLIVWEDTREPVALFDLEADPLEDHNLIDDPAQATVRQQLMEDHVRPFLGRPPLKKGPHMVERHLAGMDVRNRR